MRRRSAHLLRRLSRGDAVAFVALGVLAVGVVVTGRIERAHLLPRAAVQTSTMLTDLDIPGRLPDVQLTDGMGEPKTATLLARIHRRRAVVSFYAPWCEPCQHELPALHDAVGKRADVVVVVSADEDLEACRRRISNLGLEHIGFVVDTTGELARAGHVTALPTAFVVTRTGAVLARSRGYSTFDLWRLARAADPGADE